VAQVAQEDFPAVQAAVAARPSIQVLRVRAAREAVALSS
jgi:hypothetical protein